MPVQLSGDQARQLAEALIDAFPSESELAQMVRYGNVARNLAAIAGSGRLTDVVYQLLVWAEARAKIGDLMVAARNANPTNPLLRAVAEDIGLAPAAPPQGKLEQIVLKSVRFANVEQWRQQMGASELAVCRVEIPADTGVGTGFLVGPDLVMTNHHVVQRAILNPALSSTVAIRFDYKTSADGATVQSGPLYKLAAGTNWLVDSSPNDQLDYALLRLDGSPGQQPVGGQAGAPQRGWLKPQAHTFDVGEPLCIIQHPKAAPLKYASGSVSGIKAGGDRVTYTANTDDGSSGSPCFDSDWELVALHHYGDPTGNEGIAFSAILAQPKVKAALT